MMTIRYVAKNELVSVGKQIVQAAKAGFIIENGSGGAIWISEIDFAAARKSPGTQVGIYETNPAPKPKIQLATN